MILFPRNAHCLECRHFLGVKQQDGKDIDRDPHLCQRFLGMMIPTPILMG